MKIFHENGNHRKYRRYHGNFKPRMKTRIANKFYKKLLILRKLEHVLKKIKYFASFRLTCLYGSPRKIVIKFKEWVQTYQKFKKKFGIGMGKSISIDMVTVLYQESCD